MEKEFKTIEEQITLLQMKNLHIENIPFAKNVLLNNNYYYLINGYKDLFIDKHSANKTFLPNARLEEIYQLYWFDRKLRTIFLEYILLIEQKIDSCIAYEFSKKYGHKNYLVPENFNNTPKNKDLIHKFINDIHLEISHQYKNSNKMIVHYLDTYHYIPLWVLVRILSFGKISKFYSFMKQKEQNNICKNFHIPNHILKTYLINLGNVRNICAHDEKLFDIILKTRINVTPYHKLLGLSKHGNNSTYATRDLFSVVIVLKILLENHSFQEFYLKIITALENLKIGLSSISIHKVLSKMGFPKNYEKLLFL